MNPTATNNYVHLSTARSSISDSVNEEYNHRPTNETRRSNRHSLNSNSYASTENHHNDVDIAPTVPPRRTRSRLSSSRSQHWDI